MEMLRALLFFYATCYAIFFHDECIKKCPPQGTLLRSTRHSAEELVNTPISTLLGNSTAAGNKATLAGEEPPLHPIRSGIAGDKNPQCTLWGYHNL